MGREFELKYAATAQILSALAAQYPDASVICMESTYYDTAAGDLSARRMTLRLRRENGQGVCTLKTPLDDGSRGEWECPADSMDDGLRRLRAQGAPILSLCVGDLIPVCAARFTRRAVTVKTADGTAELALDEGVLLGGDRQIPLCEIEVELKSGSDEATAAFAEHLARIYGLHKETKSKFRRALALAQEG